MRRENIIILLVILLIAVLIGYLYYSNKETKTVYKWHKTLNNSEKEPYDIGLFLKLIKQESRNVTVLADEMRYTLGDEESNQVTYLFIGESYYLNKEELNTLLQFVKRGNHAMIITESLPDTLLQALTVYGQPLKLNRIVAEEVELKSSNVHSKFGTQKLRFKGYSNTDISSVDWNFFADSEYKDYPDFITSFAPMSTLDGKVNQAYFTFGQGSIRINTSPILFSNYILSSRPYLDYANEMMNGLKMDRLIIDNFSNQPKDDAERMQRNSPSPLSYILAHKELRMAWYLLLGTALLFLLFKAKRVQRIIPVLERKRNTTKAFVETMSGLFYNQSNHKEMAVLKMHLFQFFLKSKLSVSTQEVNSKTIQHISIRANVPESIVHEIFEYYSHRIVTSDDIDANTLMDFYNRINQFYKLYNKNK